LVILNLSPFLSEFLLMIEVENMSLAMISGFEEVRAPANTSETTTTCGIYEREKTQRKRRATSPMNNHFE
jgi:hypothetical protein